jgi:DNA-binding CsgD family transcriptional regulator
MHRRLADVVEDSEQRALHLALSAEGPDEAVAAALEEAARAAVGRAAPGAAADLLERGLRLTPVARVDDAERRRHDASMLHWIAGDDVRASALLEDAVGSLEPGPHRALALTRLARLRKHAGWLSASVELDRRALAEPGNDLQARSEAHEDIAWALLFQRRDLPQAARHARAGAELSEKLGEPAQLMDALSALGQAEFLLGSGLPSPAMERALALAGRAPGTRTLRLATVHAALLLTCADELDRARASYEEARHHALARGDESAASWVLMRLALVDCLAGRWGRALEHVHAGLDITGATAQWLSRLALLAMEALIMALRGDAERARQLGRAAVELGEQRAAGVVLHPALWALGTLELALDNPIAAERQLSRLWQLTEAAGIADPGERRFAGDLIETWLALGRPDDALRPIEWLELRGRELRRSSALAIAGRGRGLLAAEAGKLDDALAHFDQALAEHARAPLPFEHARTMLALGGVLRRAKRKREARARLTEALATFNELGALLWAARAEEELSRISGRAPGPGGLTPAEQRVAALVAGGRTNREVAAALFLSERTVESHLSHVYGKLGVRSRTELAARYANST